MKLKWLYYDSPNVLVGAQPMPSLPLPIKLLLGVLVLVGLWLSPTAAYAATPLFGNSTPFGPGTGTGNVTLGDLDGDGDLDIVVGDYERQSFIYWNDGSGNFTSPATPIGPESGLTSAAVVGDLDGDDSLDIIAVDFWGESLIYWNDGSGGFMTSTPFGVGTAITAVALEDLDEDGALDLITGLSQTQSLIYWNDGSGGFDPNTSTPFGTAEGIHTITTGDLDGDGFIDLLAGDIVGQHAIYWNDGKRGFTSVTPFGSGSHLTAIRLGDMNGDGALDIVSDYGMQNFVYWNDGERGFTSVTPFGDFSGDTIVALGDLNGDGARDIVVGNRTRQNFIYWNDGSGSFNTASPFGYSEGRTSAVVLEDMNGDGSLDLVVGGSGVQSHIYWNHRSGGLDTSTRFGDTGDSTEAVALGDLNGDGALEIVAGDTWGHNFIYWNDGNGGFDTFTPFGNGSGIGMVALGDLNGDGALDLVTRSSLSVQNFIYWNDGKGGFTNSTPFGNDSDTSVIALGDLNGDGALDLVGNRQGQSSVYWNDGRGNFTTSTLVGTGYIVAIGDLNRDGALDMALSSFEKNAIYWNDGSGNFTISTPFGSESDQTTFIVLGDLNSDGALDMVTNGYGSPTFIYWNDGHGGFAPPVPFGTDATITSVTLGDLNRDGALDLVAANKVGGDSLVYWNDGSGEFNTSSTLGIGANISSVALGDLNRDGAPELVAGNLGGQGYIFWNNNIGGFTPFGASTDEFDDLTLGDLNGDGALDMFVSNFIEEDLIHWNNGNGVFSNTTPFGTFSSSVAMELGDLDGDGALDLIGNDLGQSFVYWNDGKGSFDTTTAIGSNGAGIGVLALGDLNGDGTLDLITRDSWGQSFIYWNDGSRGFANSTPFGNGPDTNMTALGDLNGDGALDLVGNRQGQGFIYWNDGSGGFGTSTAFGGGFGITVVALGDLNGDGALDLVGANTRGQNFVHWNDGSGGFNTSTPFGTGLGITTVVLGDLSGDGALDLVAAGYRGESFIFWNNGSGGFNASTAFGNSSDVTTAVALGDMDGDGDLDLVVGNHRSQSYIYWNELRSSSGLTNAQPSIALHRPDGTADAAFYSTPTILDDSTIAVPYRLFDAESDPAGYIKAYYSLNGGGEWLPAIAASGTQTVALSTAPYPTVAEGNSHVYFWDTFASGIFGRYDNVVFRIEVYVQSPYIGDSQHYQYKDQASGPYLWPYRSATTFSFRVRGTQVRVMNQTGEASVQPGAIVYRLPHGQASGTTMTNAGGRTLRTDSQGYLSGHGRIVPGDQLMALIPISYTGSYTLFATSAAPSDSGVAAHTVSQAGVQTLTVSVDNPLLIFNLDVSLEWDASQDVAYLQQLEQDLHKSAAALYDWSNGQVALGELNVYQARERWDEADVHVFASNQVRPAANRGGIVTATTVLTAPTLIQPITANRGEIRIGPTWNRYGDAGPIGDDWPRVLAHEISHYALFLEDSYLGLDPELGLLIPITSCTGTAMSDPYEESGSEWRSRDERWQAECGPTLAELPDWEIVRLAYPALHAPPPENSGPASMPFAFTQVTVKPPATTLPALLADDAIALNGQGTALAGGRAYLIRAGQQIIDLGRPIQDTMRARGAHEGDELCIFAATQFTCSKLNNTQPPDLILGANWQAEIVLSPVSTTTVRIWIDDGSHTAVTAVIYPNGVNPQTVTLTSGVTQTVVLNQPTVEALVDVQGSSPQQRLITSYAAGSGGGRAYSHDGPGRAYSHDGPFTSGDGRITLYPPTQMPKDDFMVLQTATSLPELPAGRLPIGRAYQVRTSAGSVDYSGASIVFQYIGLDVLLSKQPEESLTVYFWGGSSWQPLPTVLNTTQNMASAPVPGPGLYTLMAGLQISLRHAGWNLVGYPVQETRRVPDALASINGLYKIVYGYDEAEATDPWELYAVDVPEWVNDLDTLEFGRGYWISVTQAITLYLTNGIAAAEVANDGAQLPPATYYGRVLPNSMLTPRAGLPVVVYIENVLCGSGQTQLVDGQIVYVVDVLTANPGDGAKCGTVGRSVTFQVDGTVLATDILWDNNRVNNLDLGGEGRVARYLYYLPMIPVSHVEGGVITTSRQYLPSIGQ